MESTEFNYETSLDNSRIYRNYKNNNTSNVNLTIDNNDTGIRDIQEKGIFSIGSEYQETDKFPIKKSILDSPQIDIKPLKLSLTFSNEVEDLIIQDLTFRKFISEIERSLNEFIDLVKVKLENKIFFEEDWEIPDYKKLVLSLNFKGINFKQEMVLWKKINTITYERIKSMLHYNSEEQISRIKELKKSFFIKLEI